MKKHNKPVAEEVSVKTKFPLQDHDRSCIDPLPVPDETPEWSMQDTSFRPEKSILESGEIVVAEELRDILSSHSNVEEESKHTKVFSVSSYEDSNKDILFGLDDDNNLLADNFYNGEFVLDQDICVGEGGRSMTKELINMGFAVTYKESLQ